ncbi:MAG: preprotein translocase subunit SecE [Anaerovoracaceae bacterium]|jgi:preprotein translocase subunit SecE
MEKKSAVNTNAKKRISLREYFKGVKIEMKKVVWPTKKELVSFTSVVILTCFIFALVFWAFDSAFLALLKAVLNIRI